MSDLLSIVGGDNFARRQHADMSLRTLYILGVELAIVIDGGVDLLHDGVRAFREPASPHAIAHELALLAPLTDG